MKQPIESHKRLVSVIIPVMDTIKYLKEAIHSVKSSTYTNIEIVIIDNITNKFNSKQIRSYAKDKDITIRYLKNNEPQKALECINTGINLATGDYITILLPTDMFDKTYIEKGAELLAGSYGSVIHPFIWNIGYVDKTKGANITYSFHQHKGLIKTKNYLAYCSMFKKDDWERVGRFPEHNLGDHEFWMKLEDIGLIFWLLPEPLLQRRIARR